MPGEDVLEIEVTDEVVGELVVDTTGKEKPVKVEKTSEDEGVKVLKDQLNHLNQARAQDQQTISTLKAEVQTVKGESVESQSLAVDNAIAAAKAEAEGFARDQVAAMEAGEFGKAADLGRKAARAEAQLVHLEQSKGDLDIAAKNIKTEKTTPQRTEGRVSADPLEAALANVSPKSAQWLRDHPEFVTDPKKALKANAADASAVAEGHVRDTPAYFDFCERFLGLKEDEIETEEVTEQTTQPARKKPMTAAPVNRGGPGSGDPVQRTKVTLTPGEQRAAQDGTLVWERDDPKGKFKKGEPLGLQEYARRKAAMTKEGRYDRSMTDQ